MIRPLIWRELTVISRTGAYWMAMAVHIGLLAALVVIWSDGIPVLDGTFLDQFVTVQTAVLSVLLPWMAVRCGGTDAAGSPALLAATTALRPSLVVAAKCAGLGAALAVIVTSGAPLMILAQRISALPWLRVPLDVLPLLALSLFVAVVSTATILLPVSRLARWWMATAATAGAVYWTPSGAISTMAFVGVGLIGSVVLSLRADSSLRYVPDCHAG